MVATVRAARVEEQKMRVRWGVAAGAFFAIMILASAVRTARAQQPEAPTAPPPQASTQARSGEDAWWGGSPWTTEDRHFLYYPDPPKPRPRASLRAPEPAQRASQPGQAPTLQPPVAPGTPSQLLELKDVEAFRKELDRLKSQAIMNPTPDNLQAYLLGNKLMMDKAGYFADQWRRVVWQNPALDFNQVRPTANFALVEQRVQADEQRKTTVQNLGKTHGLLYFFRSDCSACKLQAPALLAFSRQFGVEIASVSLDGRIPPNYPLPKPRLDNGISMIVTNGQGVQTVPALYFVSHDTKTVQPLGVGVLAGDEIAERIRVLMDTRVGDDYNKGVIRQ